MTAEADEVRAIQAEVLDAAHAMTNERTEALSQEAFSSSYPDPAPWRIGPFRRDDELAFRLEGQWADPAAVGWTSESIFNPTIVPDGVDRCLRPPATRASCWSPTPVGPRLCATRVIPCWRYVAATCSSGRSGAVI